MELHVHPEPELEFGRGTHVCPRAGISAYDVYDSRLAARRDRIHVGAIGTADGLEDLDAWLNRCGNAIPGRINAKQPTLFPGFPGFNGAGGFRAELVNAEELTRKIPRSEIRRVLEIKSHDTRVQEAVDLYFIEADFLAQNRSVDVIVCVLPDDLYDVISTRTPQPVEESVEAPEPDDSLEMNFRRALKAACLHLAVPLQLIRTASLQPSPDGMQDDATRAWNFCTAVYYKANRTAPWRLPPNANRPGVCYAGIGFFRSRDREVLSTSLAQIFNELGNGVILRGTPVDVNKDDRRPFLRPEQAETLLRRALEEYRKALGQAPARLVLHRTSRYRHEEIEAFRAAANAENVPTVDFVTISDTDLRLFRRGLYPPVRGSRVEISRDQHLLYTRGSVPYYGTYPGMYVPQPVRVTVNEADESPAALCREILALTKMNWNNTQLDGKYPITLQCARHVGDILKYTQADQRPPISYGFYM